MKITNQKLIDAVVDVLAGPMCGMYLCRRTGRKIQAMSVTTLIEELKFKGWRNISGLSHDLNDSGFRYVVADANPNAGISGDWVQVYSDGSQGRTVAKWTTLVTI